MAQFENYPPQMANGPLPAKGHVSVGIAAPPDVVWDVLEDPSVCARFSPELQSAELDGGGALVPGARILGRNERAGRSWTTRSTVLDVEEHRRLSWATGDPPAATWAFVLDEVPEGTRLRHEVTLHADVDPLDAAIRANPEDAEAIVEGRMAELVAGMHATVEGIAALSEGRGGVDPLPAR